MKSYVYLIDTKPLIIFLNGNYCRIEIEVWNKWVFQFFCVRGVFFNYFRT